MLNYSIMPLDTNHIDEICNDIKEQYEKGVATLALFMVKLVPEGSPVINKAKINAEKYAMFRDRLNAMGIKCGILAQCTIGHGYKLSSLPPFQQYTNLKDGKEEHITCPSDEGFMDYIRESFATLAKEKPEMIMVDDDFRLIWRNGYGCACPLHLKEIEKNYGAPLERERILSALRGNSKEDKRITEIFVNSQIDSLVTAARAMREGIDLVDKTIPGSFCACGLSVEGAAEIAKILAGENNPVVVRINNGNYHPAGARYLSSAFQRAAIQATVLKSQGKVDYILAETDTCPQNRYSTSAQSLHSHFVGTILEGASGAKHWITKLNEFQPKSGVAYRKKLSEYRGFYEALSREVPKLNWLGCRAPLSTTPSYIFMPSAQNNWVRCTLERLGLPVYFSGKAGGAVFLDGALPNIFTDEELLEMLSGTVFLDADAAIAIQERGLGKYLGVTVKEWNGAAMMREVILKEDKRIVKQVNARHLIPAPSAREESVICDLPDGKTEVPLCPGSVFFKNELGGNVITFAGTASTQFVYYEFTYLDESRKLQLARLLKETGNLPVYYTGDAEVYLKAARHEDGDLFVALFNIGFDALETIELDCEDAVNKVEMLLPDGTKKECKFEKHGSVIEVFEKALTLEPVILYLKK